MRNLFLALLLANLLFLGWRYWVAPEEVPATRLLAPGKEASLQTLRDGASPQPQASRAAKGGASGPAFAAPGNGQCVRIGPIAEGPLAQALKGRLVRAGFDAAVLAEEGQIWVGHWVQLESVATREEADRVVARLAAGGLPDVYVLQTTPPYSISLGVFRDQERADKVASIASGLGFKPMTTDRFRMGTQYWLWVVEQADRPVPVNALGQESGQILRSEQVRCSNRPIVGPGAD